MQELRDREREREKKPSSTERIPCTEMLKVNVSVKPSFTECK